MIRLALAALIQCALVSAQGEFFCKGRGGTSLAITCGGDTELAGGSPTFRAFIGRMAVPLVLSLFTNGCFMVGEVAMLVAGPCHAQRKRIDGFVHTLTGPVSVFAFYQGDTLASVLFFLTLWHFLMDCASTRPSRVLLLPRAGRQGASYVLDTVRWVESIMIFSHHVLIGSVKLAVGAALLEVRASSQPYPVPTPLRSVPSSQAPSQPGLLLLFIIAAGLAHLSFGLLSFSLRGSARILAISQARAHAAVGTVHEPTPLCDVRASPRQAMRLGADISIAATDSVGDWRYLMIGDGIWVLTMFALRGLVVYLQAKGLDKHKDPACLECGTTRLLAGSNDDDDDGAFVRDIHALCRPRTSNPRLRPRVACCLLSCSLAARSCMAARRPLPGEGDAQPAHLPRARLARWRVRAQRRPEAAARRGDRGVLVVKARAARERGTRLWPRGIVHEGVP